MADEPRDPWEGTLLYPPTEATAGQAPPATPPAAGQPEEHRAEIILTLAVIGMFPVFGIVAFAAATMALIDLRKMAQGTMDRSGRTQTIIGLSLSLLEIFVIGCAIIYWFTHSVAAAAPPH